MTAAAPAGPIGTDEPQVAGVALEGADNGAGPSREPRGDGERRSRRGGRRRRGRGGAGRGAGAVTGGSPTQPEFDLGGEHADEPMDAGATVELPAHREPPRGEGESPRDVDTARLEKPRFEPPSVSWSGAVPQSDHAPGPERSE